MPLNRGVVAPIVDTKTLLDPAALTKAYPGANDAVWKLWSWSFFLALVYAGARWKFRRWSGLVVVFVIIAALGFTIPGSVAEGGRRLARYGVVSLRLVDTGFTVDYATVR
ncbi:hypothetical protein [Amycolatopsis sp. lyj-23]|uniref:hypothetical protein n=1 Tax=Amycolatopsis sp. lyj-23 TaxID=2789283 RepID=UPI00397B6745